MAFNVLVVDDSAVMRTMVVRTLKMTGVEVGDIHQACNGEEALAVLRDHWVDLALVDINMPVMNGEQLIDAVRDDPLTRDLSIIVVSTESSATRVSHIRSRGAAFVHKPFTAEALRKVILEVTGVPDVQPAPVGTSPGDELDF